MRFEMRSSPDQPADSAKLRPKHEGAADAERYRAFHEQDAVGIVEVDLHGRFLMVNDHFCQMTGYTRDELLQLRFQEITPPEDLPRNLVKLESLIEGGPAHAYEKRYRRKDGASVWVFLSVSRLKGTGGASPSFLAIVVDVSERHRAELAAKANNARYHALFNSIDAGFCVIDVIFDAEKQPIDYVFLEVNRGFEAATGLRNATGRRMRELAPAHEQHWFDIYGRVALTGEPLRFEQEARALQRWYSVYAFRIGAADDHQVAILFEDISARKRSEHRRAFLNDLAERLAVLRTENDIVAAVVAAVGQALNVARSFFFACSESENRIIVSADFVRGDAPHLPRELRLFDFGGQEWWQATLRGNLAVADVFEHPLTKDMAAAYRGLGMGSYLVQPYRSDGPWTVGLAVADDVPRQWTSDEIKLIDDVIARVWPMIERARSEAALAGERAALESRVAERTATLQETISELEAFSYSISHDLRAPLRAMQTYASILSTECRAQLNEEGQEYLRRIRVAADRMDRLIQDVLVFNRAARAQMPLERVELSSFIASVIESYPGLSDATPEIELVSPLGAVRANPAALTQCISNLLGNALKFARPGVKPKIRIWSETDAGYLRVFIRDNGIGIPVSERERIFGMFYRINQSSEGTGVGLAVVRKAAERMGGAIGLAETADGPGSTFWLKLPVAKGD
jgi:PAS domain S-box-containing protein